MDVLDQLQRFLDGGSPPVLTPTQLTVQNDGSASLTLTVPIGLRVVLEASSDLRQWGTLVNVVTSRSTLNAADPAAATASARFHRVSYSLP